MQEQENKKMYRCKNIETSQFVSEEKIEAIFNEMASQGYKYVGNFPADVASSGRIYSTNHIFEKME